MAYYVNNQQATDTYTVAGALSLGPFDTIDTASILVSGNPASFQFFLPPTGLPQLDDQHEFLAPSGPGTINAFKVGNIRGLRVRNTNPGQVSTVSIALFHQGGYDPDSHDPVFESGIISPGNIGPAGVINPITGPLVFNVKDYGAKGDGVSDDFAAIQKAINAAQAVGGGVVYLPPAIYFCGSTLGIAGPCVQLLGAGRGAGASGGTGSVLLFPNAGDCININGGAVDAYYCAVSQLTIKKAAGSSGYAITLDGHNVCTISEVALVNAYHGIRVGAGGGLGSGSLVIEDVYGNVDPAGIAVDLEGATNGIWLSRLNMFTTLGTTGIGLRLPNGPACGSLDTLYVSDCLFQKFAYGLFAAPTNAAAQVVQDVFISSTIFDGIQIYGCLIQPSGASKCVNFTFEDCWFTSGAQTGVLVDGLAGLTDGISFRGCLIHGCQKQGVVVQGVPLNVEFDDCKIYACSLQGAAAFAALEVAGTVSKCRVRGCTIGSYAGSGASQASYGIQLDNGASDFVVEGNDVNGNLTGGINDQTTAGVRRYIRHNSGHNPRGPLAAPAVPATGVALISPFAVDADVYISAGASTCQVQLAGTTMATLPAGGVGTFKVPAGTTITLTYTAAPSWAWYGN